MNRSLRVARVLTFVALGARAVPRDLKFLRRDTEMIRSTEHGGAVLKVTMSYPRDYMRQQLAYAFENRHVHPHHGPRPAPVLQ